MTRLNEHKHTLYCSFCGKSQFEVVKLIVGPTVFICNECIELCVDVVKHGIAKDNMYPETYAAIGDECEKYYGVLIHDYSQDDGYTYPSCYEPLS